VQIGTGFEQPARNAGKTSNPQLGGAGCGAPGERSALIDAGLRSVVEAWPNLDDATKAGILAMMRAAE